jgi:hypothetical protein
MLTAGAHINLFRIEQDRLALEIPERVLLGGAHERAGRRILGRARRGRPSATRYLSFAKTPSSREIVGFLTIPDFTGLCSRSPVS